MELFRRGPESSNWRPAALALPTLALLAACASPGPPRSPSLHIPQPVRDLAAHRVGDIVELTFTAPSQSTDKLPLHENFLNATLCRAVDAGPCIVLPGFSAAPAIASEAPHGGPNRVTWRDPLPVTLLSGPRRLMRYRVEFFSAAGKSAGKSEAAYAVAGPPPPPVQDLTVAGTRNGVLLRWRPESVPAAAATTAQTGPDTTTVLVERTALAAAPASNPSPQTPEASGSSPSAKSPSGRSQPRKNAGKGKQSAHPGASHPPSPAKPINVLWLDSNATAGTGSGAETLDRTAVPGTPYRYLALRRTLVTLGGRTLELQSVPSAPVTFTLHEIYAPPMPAGLMAAGYQSTGSSPSADASSSDRFAVDLIWQPIDDAGLIAGLAGYNVYRLTLPAMAGQNGTKSRGTRLNTTPIPTPAFHDSTADAAHSYRYAVTAIDNKGNESPAATVVVQGSATAN